MKLSRSKLRQIIKEELSATHPSDVEPVEDVWDGCPKADMLAHPLDHSVVGGSEPVTKDQEILDIVSESDCGEAISLVDPMDAAVEILETESPEGQLVLEMEVAKRSLEDAVDSIGQASRLCPGCVSEVAVAAPLIDALTTQAAALKETLEAIDTIIKEGVEESPKVVISQTSIVPDPVLDGV